MSDFNTLQLFLIKCQAYLVIPGITKSWILLKSPTIVLNYFSDFHQAKQSHPENAEWTPCDIIRTAFHVRRSPLCPGMSSAVWSQWTHLSWTTCGNARAAPFSASLSWQSLQLLFRCARGTETVSWVFFNKLRQEGSGQKVMLLTPESDNSEEVEFNPWSHLLMTAHHLRILACVCLGGSC